MSIVSRPAYTEKEILSHVDHTLLSPAATKEQIRRLCDEAIRYRTASVCVPPSFVRFCSDYGGDGLTVCTVIGFPCGYAKTEVKLLEAEQALKDGAKELDTVIPIGALKEGRDTEVLSELRALCALRDRFQGAVLKVIIETCLLTEEEKIRACRLVGEAGADFIKTSTGFSKGGATAADVELLRRYSPPSVKVKAAGGIATLEDARLFLSLGADRLGSSRLVELCRSALSEVEE